MGLHYDFGEGHGGDTEGGKGGTVVEVTHGLDDGSVGSLRRALEDTDGNGKREIKFTAFSGALEVDARIDVVGQCSVLGYTSPNGVWLENTNNLLDTQALQITDEQIMIQGITFALGDPGFINTVTGFVVAADANNILIDHITGRWCIDKTFTIFSGGLNSSARNVTVQNSLFYHGYYCANHKKTVDPAQGAAGPCGPNTPTQEGHSRMTTISGSPQYTGFDRVKNVTLLRNAYAHFNKRVPCNVVDAGFAGAIDVVNCVSFNVGDLGCNIGSKQDSPGSPDPFHQPGGFMNYRKNVFIQGPNTEPGLNAVNVNDQTFEGEAEVYFEDNLMVGDVVEHNDRFNEIDGLKRDTPHDYIECESELPAEQAMWSVLADAGARLDYHDDRIIIQIKNGYKAALAGTIGDHIPPGPDAPEEYNPCLGGIINDKSELPT